MGDNAPLNRQIGGGGFKQKCEKVAQTKMSMKNGWKIDYNVKVHSF